MRDNSTRRFGFWVRCMLWWAGWRAGQSRIVPWDELPKVPLFPSAKKVLVELFGLKIGTGGKGRDLGRVRLEVDPRALIGNEPDILRLSEEMQVKLYPLGEIDGGNAILLIDERDWTYIWCGEKPMLVAHSFDDALERMLLGRKYVCQDDGSQAS